MATLHGQLPCRGWPSPPEELGDIPTCPVGDVLRPPVAPPCRVLLGLWLSSLMWLSPGLGPVSEQRVPPPRGTSAGLLHMPPAWLPCEVPGVESACGLLVHR